MRPLRTNRAYAGKIPFRFDAEVAGYVLDMDSRPIQEDVAYGLEIYLEAGRRLAVALPVIGEIYHWLTCVIGAPALHPFPYLPNLWPLRDPINASAIPGPDYETDTRVSAAAR